MSEMTEMSNGNSLEWTRRTRRYISMTTTMMTTGMSSADDGDEWSCDECTYINVADSLTCIMCYRVRVASCMHASAHWQWRANEQQFITFDALANANIESAFKSGAVDTDVVAASGGAYRIVFDRDGDAHYQQNKRNGAERAVRRIGKDSTRIFIREDATRNGEEAKCAICQCEVGDAADDVYRLAVCAPGHSFHGECVVSWVMMHSRCPVCQSSI